MYCYGVCIVLHTCYVYIVYKQYRYTAPEQRAGKALSLRGGGGGGRAARRSVSSTNKMACL